MSQMSSQLYATRTIAGAFGNAEAYASDLGHDDAEEMTISQVARLFGVSLRTLRFYEDRGLLKPRREGNARYYGEKDRTRMDMILRGKKLGFTLTEISDLVADKSGETTNIEDRLEPQQIANQIGHLERQREEIDSAIARLKATRSRSADHVAA
jgi:DNA-binding transcriptional MerR regulator